MKKRLRTMLLTLVAIIMPIGAWAYYEPESVPINIGTSGVATLYYGAHNLVIPEGVSASVITGVDVNEDGIVTVTEQPVDNIIPADCAVILRGESGSYEFLIEEHPVEVPESNLLRGTDEDTEIREGGYLYFYLPEDSESSDWIYVGNEVNNKAHKAYLALPVEEYSKLAAMLGALDNPHLQHTHGGCEICDQNTGVIVINMSDSYGDGWNGASITVKKDGEELDETVTIEDEDGTEATVTLVYDLESRYTFYWNMGEGDGECSFEIIIDGEQVFYANVDNFEFNEGIFFGTGDPYVVSFNANGGSGSMENVETYESVTLPECTFNAPDGMMFKAWLVGEEEYQPEDEIVVTEDTEIKAVWTVFVPQIVIKMKDLYYDGWNGAYITVKKDGEELGTATVEKDFDTNTVTFTYDPTCEYTFYWTEGDYDNECSFEIRVNGKKVSEALQCESESGPVSDCEDLTTEEPFFTLEATAIAEAAWGTSADAETFTYGTLADAFEAAYTYDEENETYISTEVCYIQLLSDITNYNAYSISGGEYTFDLNGHTISSEGHTLYIANNSNVTIVDNSETKSGKVISSGEGCFAVCVDNSASVTINGGTYESTLHYALNVQGNNSSVTINGGSYVSSYLPVLIGEDCSATIVGGTFKYTGASAIENYGNLVVKGGTFTYDGDVDPDSYYTTINHFGGSIDLSDHPTDAINSIDVTNSSGEDITPGAETILLPEDYCFFDYSDDTPVTVLVYGGFYYIGEEPAKCTIAFDAGDGEGEMEDEIIYVGDYTLPECTFTAPEGMGFKAWLVGEDELQPREVVTIEANTTITAVWATLFEVSFDANGGTGSMDAVTTFSDFTLPECTFTAPEGMMFKAWQIDGGEYQPYEPVSIEGNTTIKALWTAYVPQIIIKMHDSAGDGWHGDAIVVKKNGKEIGTATIEGYGSNGIVRYDYDNTTDYTFYWQYAEHESRYPEECSFEILIDEEEVFAAVRDEEENTFDCQSYENGELIHTIEGEAQVVESLTIVDGELTEYNNTVSFTTVGTLTYTRTLPNLMWNALYVPFEIPLSELADNYDVAYINDIRSYDNDENGEIDDMTMEIIRINSGTLNANHPYLIRAKNEEAQNMEIVLNDATLYSTEEISLNCSSMYMEFTITGTYNTLSYEDLEEKYAISTSGAWQKLSAGSSLKPFRLYMEMTPRDGSPVKVEAAALSRIRINMQGEGGNTTGVEVLETPQNINDAVLYDLYGRKVTTPVKGGIYISNGKKVIVN